jgi:hypothetical protein
MAIFTMRLIQGHALHRILLLGDFFFALAREKNGANKRSKYFIYFFLRLERGEYK